TWFAFGGCQRSNSTSGTSMAAASKNAGHLTVRRAANFGSRVALNVSIDGAQVALLREGQSYNGTLSAGEHVISVNVTPSRARGGAAAKRRMAQAGPGHPLPPQRAQRRPSPACGTPQPLQRPALLTLVPRPSSTP